MNPLVQAEHQGTTSAGFRSFFSPNPQPKALDQRTSLPCPSSQSLPQPAPGTGLVSFLSRFSFTVCIFFSISSKSLLLCLAYQRCFFHSVSTFPLSPMQIFVPPGKWHFLHLSCFAPCPLTLPSFCCVFPLVSPDDLLQLSSVPPLPPYICICFRETSCCLEAELDSRGPKAKWRFGYSSSVSRWKESAESDL